MDLDYEGDVEREALSKRARMIAQGAQGNDIDMNILGMINDEMMHTSMGSKERTHILPHITKLSREAKPDIAPYEAENWEHYTRGEATPYSYFMSRMSRASKYEDSTIRDAFIHHLYRIIPGVSHVVDFYEDRDDPDYDYRSLYDDVMTSVINKNPKEVSDILVRNPDSVAAFRYKDATGKTVERNVNFDVNPFLRMKQLTRRMHDNKYDPATGVFGR